MCQALEAWHHANGTPVGRMSLGAHAEALASCDAPLQLRQRLESARERRRLGGRLDLLDRLGGQ